MLVVASKVNFLLLFREAGVKRCNWILLSSDVIHFFGSAVLIWYFHCGRWIEYVNVIALSFLALPIFLANHLHHLLPHYFDTGLLVKLSVG